MKKDNSGQAKSGMTNVNMILSTPVHNNEEGRNPSRNKEVTKIIAVHESMVMELQEMSVSKDGHSSLDVT